MRLSAALLTTVALVAAVPSATAHTTRAVPAAEGALPGHVCFWPEPNETGAGGGWCHNGTGYAEAASQVKRHAKSFSNQTQDTFYALNFPREGGCLYRTVHGSDYSGFWEWWGKLDGVQRTRPTGCQQG